jgi:hypothetical protein
MSRVKTPSQTSNKLLLELLKWRPLMPTCLEAS